MENIFAIIANGKRYLYMGGLLIFFCPEQSYLLLYLYLHYTSYTYDLLYAIKYVKEFFFLNKYTKPVSLSDDINILIGNYFSITINFCYCVMGEVKERERIVT